MYLIVLLILLAIASTSRRMVSKHMLVFFMLNVFVFCQSAFVDNLTKCSINDANCNKKMLQNAVQEIAITGIPEIDLPPIDPITLKNITIDVPSFGEFTLVEGQIKGVKDCIIDKVDTNLESERAFFEFTCDVTAKGKYKIFSDSPLVKNFLNGKTIHGEGNGKVKIEKLKIKIDFKFVIKKKDGEYYIHLNTDKTKYDYDVKGKMLFFADKIYIGDVESSKMVTGLLNDNWKFLIGTFGRSFADKALEYLYVFMKKFFENTPAKHYLTDDLSSYAVE